jgi:hypothetical protein
MIITQVHLVLGTIKGDSKMWTFVTQCHRCLSWGSMQLACWLQECTPELLPDHCRFREFGSMSNWHHNQTTYKYNHASPGPQHPGSLPAGLSETNHSDSWGNWGILKTNSDWLALTPKWVGLCPPRPTHGCASAQSCEIHRLEHNEFISIDWFPYMNCNCKIVKFIAFYIFVQYILAKVFAHTIAYHRLRLTLCFRSPTNRHFLFKVVELYTAFTFRRQRYGLQCRLYFMYFLVGRCWKYQSQNDKTD